MLQTKEEGQRRRTCSKKGGRSDWKKARVETEEEGKHKRGKKTEGEGRTRKAGEERKDDKSRKRREEKTKKKKEVYSTSPSGGNQVDGLPPVPHTGAA